MKTFEKFTVAIVVLLSDFNTFENKISIGVSSARTQEQIQLIKGLSFASKCNKGKLAPIIAARKNVAVCCASSCKQCGGENCSKDRGGSSACCTENIYKKGRYCKDDSDTVCIVNTKMKNIQT